MSKQMQIILLLCMITILALLTLQYVWIKDYYNTVRFNFEREVNLVFEDAVKKEFSLRSDTVQILIEEQLFDSTKYKFSSKYHDKEKNYSYTINDKPIKRDLASFSSPKLDGPVIDGDTVMRRKIAILYANMIRSEDLNNHIVYYHTQQLGNFVNASILKYNFDTIRLRPVLTNYLAQKGIKEPFNFYLTNTDSTFNTLPQKYPDQKTYPIITKAIPTYKWGTNNDQYVRARFPNPIGYILSKTKWILISALLLIVSVFSALFMLLRALRKEKRLTQIKDDFIHNINHEFKTPIAVLSASIEAMTDFDILNDKSKTTRYLHYSKESINQLERLSKRILDSTLLEQKEFAIVKESFEILPILESLKNSQLISTKKDVNISIDCPSDLSVEADKNLFIDVLNNIIDNAIKYSDKSVTIGIIAKIEDNLVKLSINDNGWGIQNKDIPFIFDKFFRGHARFHAVKGHGLGLNIVSNIMQSHHGTITIKSENGKGTKVALSWPK